MNHGQETAAAATSCSAAVTKAGTQREKRSSSAREKQKQPDGARARVAEDGGARQPKNPAHLCWRNLRNSTPDLRVGRLRARFLPRWRSARALASAFARRSCPSAYPLKRGGRQPLNAESRVRERFLTLLFRGFRYQKHIWNKT